MRKLAIFIVLAILLVVALPGPSVTHAADVPVSFRGVQHSPLGTASLTLENDTLVVANIGSSGEDGVWFDVGNVKRWDAAILPLGDPADPDNPIQDGAVLKVTSRGTIGDSPNQIVTLARYEDTGSEVTATLDFSATGTTSLTANFFLGCEQVHTETVDSDVAHLLLDIWPDTFDISFIDISLDWLFGATVRTPSDSIVFADAVEVFAVDPTVPITYSSVALTAKDIPSITITDESLQVRPVGGTTQLLVGSDSPASAGEASGSSAPPYTAIAGAAAAALALTAGAWYARRRRMR